MNLYIWSVISYRKDYKYRVRSSEYYFHYTVSAAEWNTALYRSRWQRVKHAVCGVGGVLQNSSGSVMHWQGWGTPIILSADLTWTALCSSQSTQWCRRCIHKKFVFHKKSRTTASSYDRTSAGRPSERSTIKNLVPLTLQSPWWAGRVASLLQFPWCGLH